MFLEIFSYLKNFSSVTAVTEDLLLKCYSMTTFILLFMSILVTGKTQQNKSLSYRYYTTTIHPISIRKSLFE